mmetsp:Transcript_97098/g.277854  ORF Transcript_97098/g.277854 Transcript_97098/m.277854 type:complete len:110 (+) Transcript_97098:39-368(+)
MANKEEEDGLRARFNEIDLDKSGEIDKSEFKTLVKDLLDRGAPKDAKLDKLFDEADLDGSGSVDFDEFQALYGEQHYNLAAARRGASPAVHHSPFNPFATHQNGSSAEN